MDESQIKDTVRARYGSIAAASGKSCCAPTTSCGGGDGGCCRQGPAHGYSETELAAAPHGANLGLGCGNLQAITALKPSDVVVDLGCGAGFDCFLAAAQVGASAG